MQQASAYPTQGHHADLLGDGDAHEQVCFSKLRDGATMSERKATRSTQRFPPQFPLTEPTVPERPVCYFCKRQLTDLFPEPQAMRERQG